MVFSQQTVLMHTKKICSLKLTVKNVCFQPHFLQNVSMRQNAIIFFH